MSDRVRDQRSTHLRHRGGCLFQTIWNLQDGRAPEHGIKDYDIFYFDADDLSAAAEARVQQRVDRVRIRSWRVRRKALIDF